MWPKGDKPNTEVCYHHCHRGDGGKVTHISPCCKVCRYCLLNIKAECREEHEKKCMGFVEPEKR